MKSMSGFWVIGLVLGIAGFLHLALALLGFAGPADLLLLQAIAFGVMSIAAFLAHLGLRDRSTPSCSVP